MAEKRIEIGPGKSMDGRKEALREHMRRYFQQQISENICRATKAWWFDGEMCHCLVSLISHSPAGIDGLRLHDNEMLSVILV